MAQRLEEFFKKYARGRGVGIADKFAANLRKKVGHQTRTRTTASGRVVAVFPAKPFAPPRKVTGYLQSSIKVYRTAHGARVVVWAPYSVPLERLTRWYGWPHAFVKPVLKAMKLTGRNA